MKNSYPFFDMIISLTGFMGCGKSSVGKELAALLSCSFLDLDLYIEESAGRSIPEIFESEGESGFRAIEKYALSTILTCPKPEDLLILSLGGGTVTTPECADMVKEKTICIYLRASTDTLVRNLENDFGNRPMLNGRSLSSGNTKEGGMSCRGNNLPSSGLRLRIEELMKKRSGIYESTAHHIIDIDGKGVEETAQGIENILGYGHQGKKI